MIRFLKLGILALLGTCAGCAATRQSADADLRAGPAPVVGMAVGAGVNTGMLLFQRPWWQQIGAQLLMGSLKRFALHPRWEGWHLEVMVGGMTAEWASWLACHGPCDRRWK